MVAQSGFFIIRCLQHPPVYDTECFIKYIKYKNIIIINIYIFQVELSKAWNNRMFPAYNCKYLNYF